MQKYRHPFVQSRSRVSPRVYIPVLLGLFSMVMSLSAALLLRSGRVHAESKVSKMPVDVILDQPISRVEVLIPRIEIASGTSLSPEMFELKSIPEKEALRNSLHAAVEVQGFYAKALLVPGQPITRDYLTPVKPASEVIGEIPEGYRAVTIRVDERTSVEGWARAGARVDVVWSSRLEGKPMISVIVENAKILSAERQVNPHPENQENKPAPIPTTVTLLVAAEDANRIQLASVSGTMSLSLRGGNDSKANKSAPLTIDDLIRDGRPAYLPEQPRVVLSVKGAKGNRTSYAFQDGELVAIPE